MACAPREGGGGACSTRTRKRVPIEHDGEDDADRWCPPIGGREERGARAGPGRGSWGGGGVLGLGEKEKKKEGEGMGWARREEEK